MKIRGEEWDIPLEQWAKQREKRRIAVKTETARKLRATNLTGRCCGRKVVNEWSET